MEIKLGLKTIKVDSPIYIKIKNGPATKTVELIENRVFANYNAKGELLGIEVIG